MCFIILYVSFLYYAHETICINGTKNKEMFKKCFVYLKNISHEKKCIVILKSLLHHFSPTAVANFC